MTCREFKHSAASLTLWELVQTQDGEVLGHADQCESCGAWLRKQEALAASMRTLQTQTAALEAGPDVERALLRAFRQAAPAHAAGVGKRTTFLRPVATPGSTPFALRLSRFFEIGAYAAVAAAIVVVVFLGIRILQHDGGRAPVETRAAAHTMTLAVQEPATVAAAVATKSSAKPAEQAVRASHRRPPVHTRNSESGVAMTVRSTTEDSASESDAGYVALMFCDPLSCAAESQVVRMELPAGSAGQNSQPQMADVVVGYDGLVRAVRLVN